MDYTYHYTSPLGGITLASDGEALTGLWFDGQKYFMETADQTARKNGEPENAGAEHAGAENAAKEPGRPEETGDAKTAKDLPVFQQTTRWLDAYFAGKVPDFTPPLKPRGSEFRQRVWEILLTVPYGKTITYGEIASRLAARTGHGHMGAQAVGGAVGHNPISLIIPCHRVLGSDGSLTGYAGGIEKKKYLLQMESSTYIDHTLLKPEATEAQIRKLCEEAVRYRFASVCVNSCRTALCASLLSGSGVKVCVVVGFPLGAMSSQAKTFEAAQAVRDGADELDMVMNIGFMKEGAYDLVREDIAAVVHSAAGRTVKVILETCLLTDEEIVKACELAVEAGAAFVKTSTGFSTGGADPRVVRLMKETVGNRAKVKAAGGIRTPEVFRAMLDAGADRIGTSSGAALL